jgi:hypothetical protein
VDVCSVFPNRVPCEDCGQLSPTRFDPYDQLIFHDCDLDLWAAIDIETGRVSGDFDPEQIRAHARAIFDEATERVLEDLAS